MASERPEIPEYLATEQFPNRRLFKDDPDYVRPEWWETRQPHATGGAVDRALAISSKACKRQ